MLTPKERKSRLLYGAVRRTAERVGCHETTVTHVLQGIHRNRPIEVSLASMMDPRTTVTEAFGPAVRTVHRQRAKRQMAGAR